jgi:hypothetical protein
MSTTQYLVVAERFAPGNNMRMRSIHCLFGAKRLTTSGLNRCPSGTPHPHVRAEGEPILPKTQNGTSPLHRAWNVFSAIAGVIGTAGMISNMASWVGFVQTMIHSYAEIVHPILRPVTQALGFSPWFNDYLFVGLMVSSARARPTFNHMKVHWRIDVSSYKWYAFWAPHRVASILLSVLMALLWPVVLILFLPPRLIGVDDSNAFQHRIWLEQFEWLAVYILVFIGLFIANAGLRALTAEVATV